VNIAQIAWVTWSIKQHFAPSATPEGKGEAARNPFAK